MARRIQVRRSAGGARLHATLFELGQEEAVDLIPRPGAVLDCRGRLAPARAGTPTSVAGPRSARKRRLVVAFAVCRRGPRCPRRHPASSSSISAADSFCFGGIFGSSRYRTARMSRLSSGLPGTTAGPLVPPFQDRLSVRQPEAGLRFLGTVARLAFLDDQRADPFSKNSVAAGSSARSEDRSPADERAAHDQGPTAEPCGDPRLRNKRTALGHGVFSRSATSGLTNRKLSMSIACPNCRSHCRRRYTPKTGIAPQERKRKRVGFDISRLGKRRFDISRPKENESESGTGSILVGWESGGSILVG